jgi:cephalosporin hydroxylase
MNYEMFFDINTISEGHHKVTYRGIKTIKCPFDYVIYQMLLFDVKPDLIIEIGTNHGGAALYMANMLDIIGEGEIHTIDIKEYEINDLVKNHPRIKRFLGGYENYDLNLAKGFNRVMVIDDGSHTYDDVMSALGIFKDIVSVGSYFIVEDGALDKIGLGPQYGGGPNKAIFEFLDDNPNYVIDKNLCNFFGTNATFNTNGYLKKIN